MLSQDEIERRKPLWAALSDLWIAGYTFDLRSDNQTAKEVLLQRHEPAELAKIFSSMEDYDTHIARTMISSGYSLLEIETIFAREVAPVVYTNPYQLPGGEWRHFENMQLFQYILANISRQDMNPIYRAWVKSAPAKYLMTKAVRDDWEKNISLYQSILR